MNPATAIPDDSELLRRYADERSEAAFEEVVRRYLNLVHSAALRQVGGNAANAADVSQSVFIELARQSRRLTRHPTLTGWLYTATHRMSAHHVRDEIRRQRREQEAQEQLDLQHESVAAELDWNRLRPVLDDAMNDLGEIDRLAVLLRHFEQRPLAQVGACLGLSENAARMRVDRALDRLRGLLEKRGVNSTSSALGFALAGEAVIAAPAPLISTVTAGVFAVSSTASTSGFLILMASTKLKTAGAVLLIAAVGTILVQQHLLARRLRGENLDLKKRNEQMAEQATQNAEAFPRASSPDPELLQLRGEVGRLRQQLADTPEQLSPEEIAKRFVDRRLNEAKFLILGHTVFAEAHKGRAPDSLEEALARVKETFARVNLEKEKKEKEQADTLQNLRPEEFEMVYKGSLSDLKNPSSVIVLRERAVWQTSDGRWARTYGFADGHSEIHHTDDGDYTAFEAQRQAQP